jgi:hypothetical protein
VTGEKAGAFHFHTIVEYPNLDVGSDVSP